MMNLRRRTRLFAAILPLLWALSPASAAGLAIQTERTHLRYGGSSTTFPFAFLAARHAAFRTGIPLPIGEATGTSAGIQLFCGGVGPLFPDVALSSRKLSAEERAQCSAHGVTDIESLRIGNDVLAVVAKADMPPFALTLRQLWLALAATVPVNGKLVANPYGRWKDIDPTLPDLPIVVVGPSEHSGKIDTLESAVMEESCRTAPEIVAITDKLMRRRVCTSLRKDGSYIPHTLRNVDYSERLMQLDGPALALVKFGELIEFAKRIKPIPVDGVLPTITNVNTSHYPITRSLYLHAKMQHAQLIPSLRPFLDEFFLDDASGASGYLTQAGLVSLTDDERRSALAVIQKRFGDLP
jgi:phosphate transport system substrate-binding protein